MFNWFRNRRRKKILAEPWPQQWSYFLDANVRLAYRLDKGQRRKLQDLTQVFVNEKNWEGLEGVEINDEIKLTISAQACMMLLGVDDFYFDNVRTILVFPDTFRRDNYDGGEHSSRHLSGESWQDGPIVLSWMDVLFGCQTDGNGSNVVIHEFAHALDGLDGFMGGNINFDNPTLHEEWGRVVNEGYEELVKAEQVGRPTLLDHYGAQSKAEYFAVATETFFELPYEMKSEYPELFRLLVEYFKIDPRAWQ